MKFFGYPHNKVFFVVTAFALLSGTNYSYSQYCMPTVQGTGYPYEEVLGKVQIGELFNQSYESWNIINESNANVRDYTYLPPATVYPERVFNIFFEPSYMFNNYPDPPSFAAAVYIDWNNDFDFDDPGEEILNEPDVRPPFLATPRVPADIPIGTVLRVRVMMASLENATLSPCGTNSDEYEDYLIEVGSWDPYSTENIPGTAGGCNNADFEAGSYTGWRTFTGENRDYNRTNAPWDGTGTANYGCCTTEELAYGAIDPPVFGGNPVSRHAIVTPGPDPFIGVVPGVNLPQVPPGGGNFAARIGQGEAQYGAERITTTFTVTPQNAIFIYEYAVVMDEPGHAAHEQPYFQASLYDANGRVIPCSYQRITSGTGYDFIEIPDPRWNDPQYMISYKEWERVFVNLWDYIGQDVTVEFKVGDCTRQGHFGYAYVDAHCEPLHLYEESAILCQGESMTLTAPDAGGNFTYQWTRLDSVFGNEDLGTNQSITVSPTADTNIYELVLTPGIGCDVTLYDTVIVVDAIEISDVVEVCIGDNTYQMSFIISGGDPATYDVSGTHIGTLTGTGTIRTFTSDPIPINEPYNFSVTDGGDCSAFIVDGVSTCPVSCNVWPMVNAGVDTLICMEAGNSYTIGDALAIDAVDFLPLTSGTKAGVLWTTTGVGALTDETTVSPTYVPDPSETGQTIELILTGFSGETDQTFCPDVSDTMEITISAPPTAEAGDPLSTCAAPVTLTGSAINADSISWTHNGSGTIADDNTATPTYTPGVLDQGTTITLTMTAHGIAPCGNVQDSVEIIVVGGATAFAGDDAIICQDSTIAVQDVYATDYDQLIWSIITGNGTLDQSDPMAPIYTPAATDAGTTVSLELLAEVADPCTDDRDTVEIIIIGLPTANAGDDGLICQTETYTITGSDTTNASNIFWTHNGTGTLDDITTISPTYTPSPADAGTTVTLTLNVEAISPCGGITDEVDLEISPLALANAGNPSQICANEAYPLTGSATGTAYNWTHDGIGVLANPTTLTPDYTPTTAEIGNTITFTLSVTGIAPCPDTSDQVTLNIIPAPEVEAGDDTEICAGDNHTITGADTTNSTTIEWTHNGLGTIQNPGTLTPTYISSVAEAGNSVTLTLTVYPKAPCVQPIEDQLTITILSPPTADAGDRQTVCAGETVSLTNASATNQSSVNWTHDGQGTITNPTTLSPTYTPAATEAGTSVKLTLTANGNGSCLEDTDETTIRIVGPPQVTVGAMNTICYGEDYRLLGATQSNTAYVEWSHNGQGTLDDINALEPTYTAHTNDQGTAVSFTLTGYPMYPCSGTVEAQTLVRIIPKPIVEAGDNGIICANGGTHTMTGASVDHYSNFNWELIGGNPNNLSDQTTLTPSYSPSISEGNTQIQLVLTAEPNQPCTDPARDTITLNIEVVPEFTVTPGAVCPGGTVTMDIVPINTFTVDLFDWYAHPTGGTIVHTGNNYTTAPLYDSITYYVEPSRGCIGERVQVDLVVYPVPRASYSIAPSEIIDMVHTTTFTDNSTGGTTGSWDTGDSILTYTAVPTFDYTYQLEVGNIPEEVNTGLYIENQYGCKDSAYLVIPVDIKWAFYVPNAFTPGDQNQINDEFFGEGYGIVEKKMWIFNRWGDNIFYSDELTGTWDGYDHMYANGKSPIQTSPDQVKEDTYVYKIEIINVYGEKHTYIGGVNLIR